MTMRSPGVALLAALALGVGACGSIDTPTPAASGPCETTTLDPADTERELRVWRRVRHRRLGHERAARSCRSAPSSTSRWSCRRGMPRVSAGHRTLGCPRGPSRCRGYLVISPGSEPEQPGGPPNSGTRRQTTTLDPADPNASFASGAACVIVAWDTTRFPSAFTVDGGTGDPVELRAAAEQAGYSRLLLPHRVPGRSPGRERDGVRGALRAPHAQGPTVEREPVPAGPSRRRRQGLLPGLARDPVRRYGMTTRTDFVGS